MPNVYIASNRDFNRPERNDFPHIASKDGKETGELTFLAGPYDYTKPMAYNDWLEAIKAEGGVRRAMIFIHGYANPWDKVKTDLVEMVTHFWTLGTLPYQGPIILFDWPSAGFYKPAQDLARDTANLSFCSEEIPVDLAEIIHDIGYWLTVHLKVGKPDIVCHSMGNLVMQQGAGFLKENSVSQCLINAAAIAHNAFNPNSGSKTDAGDVMNCCSRVTAYYSSQDDALPAGQIIDDWIELGLKGPNYCAELYDKFFAVDCSGVVTKPIRGGAEKVHTSYYYIPQVLDDFIATLNGTESAKVKNRSPKADTDMGFDMRAENP